MESGRDSVLLAAVMVILFTGSIFATYALSAFLDEDDPIKETRCYGVSAEIDGEQCTGSGTAVYLNESEIYPNFLFTFEVNASSGVKEYEFYLLCDSDNYPTTKIYSYVKTVDVDDETTAQLWTCEQDGYDIEFLIGEYCTVYEFVFSGNGVYAKAVLTSPE